MDDEVKSLSQSSTDQYKSQLTEYEVVHNISRPLSPINLIIPTNTAFIDRINDYSSSTSLQISKSPSLL